MSSQQKIAMCRFCHALCSLKVQMQDGVAVNVVGDKHNPVYHGYSCAKGRELPNQHRHPDRLLHSVKRAKDGAFAPVAFERASAEIAARLRELLDRYGPRCVAMYSGTHSFPYATTQPMATAFMDAIASPMRFTSNTIDKPGKSIAMALHGTWAAGAQVFDRSDTWLMVGTNPLISKSGGIPNSNPARRLHLANKRGFKLIVIDPRRTEVAKKAYLHLQPRPGEDPSILAGMINVIISESLHDADFVQNNAEGFEQLQEAVKPFTPSYVEARAGIPAQQLLEAAQVFASAKGGCTTVGTGPNMAPRGMVTEYLSQVLITLCGRWLKEGESVPNNGAMMPRRNAKAQANPRGPAFGYGEKLRVRGFTDAACGLPINALPDEILMPGEGKVRALINLCGNPVSAWPDQEKTKEALQALDLHITLDWRLSETARLADYVIAPKLSLERPGLSLPNESLSFMGVGFGYPEPYAQYVPVVQSTPPGSDLIEEWEFFYHLARDMALPLNLQTCYPWAVPDPKPDPVSLDMENKPTTEELYELMTAQGRIPLAEVKKHPHGFVFTEPTDIVAPKDKDCPNRLDIGASVVLEQLGEIRAETFVSAIGTDSQAPYPFRLISRRMDRIYNSNGMQFEKLTHRYPYNPAFMHPRDLQELQLSASDIIEIASAYGSILGVVEVDDTVRPGVISMAHCFGGISNDERQVRDIGSNTGILAQFESEYDPITGIPRMSDIPVKIRAVA